MTTGTFVGAVFDPRNARRGESTALRRTVVALSLASAMLGFTTAAAAQATRAQPGIESRRVPVIRVDGRRFRDLDRNGRLDRFEDWRLLPAARAADLVARLTLEEKSGTAMHGTAPIAGGPMASGPAYDSAAASEQIVRRGVTSLITRMSIAPAVFAAQNNALQEIAERGRFAIPVTISTDPRNHFQAVGGASTAAASFSQWPEAIGFGALGDSALVRRFADVVRGEYRAVGIRMALSPQADLATEPRWSRINGTFGEEPSRVAPLVRAYVEGMQRGATALGPGGVAAVVKHWIGYGAAVDGYDGHNYYGRFSRFPAGRFDDHVAPFLGAFAAGVSAVMPTYNILDGLSLDGKPMEPVGAGFSRQLLGDLLRGRHAFRGLVLSDWMITQDCVSACRTGTPRQEPWQIAMPWGVESLSKQERFAKAMNAGVDQFGGVDDGALLAEAVRSSRVAIARLDEAVARILALKFELGLFEDPYVDPAAAASVVGSAAGRRLASRTQARATVVLENALGPVMLPRRGARLYLAGVDGAAARARGFRVAADPAQADAALVRIAAPFQSTHPTFFFGSFQHEGDLDFPPGDSTLAAVRAVAAKVPTIVVVYLDRPAILTPIKEVAKALIAEFGISDDALFDVLTGRVASEGRLPFELPSSMDEVRAQAPDVPHDTRSPLYPIGHRARPRTRPPS